MRASCVFVLALLTAALAGCASEEPETVQNSGDGTDQLPPQDPALNASQNNVPEASLTADRTTGPAPLNVTFQVTASDVDGDPLTWTLDFGDGGLEEGNESAEVVHTFEAGQYNVTLLVRDGAAEANATVSITVDDAAEPAPEESEYCEPVDVTEVAPGVYLVDGTWLFAETNGVAGAQVENNHPTAGMGAGFDNAAWDGCTGGDQMIA